MKSGISISYNDEKMEMSIHQGKWNSAFQCVEGEKELITCQYDRGLLEQIVLSCRNNNKPLSVYNQVEKRKSVFIPETNKKQMLLW